MFNPHQGLSQVQLFEKGMYFQAGRYIVTVTACKFIEGHHGESYVVEGYVQGVLSSHPLAPQKGQTATHAWSASGSKSKIGKSTWVGFLCAVLGVKQGDYSDAQWAEISRAAIDFNGLKGRTAYLECYVSKSSKRATAENPEGAFTHHKWHGQPTPEQLSEFGLG
jgi:hypothetical protein